MPALSTSGTLAAHMLLRVVEFCRRRGHDGEALCGAVGLSLAFLSEPEARVPYVAVASLTERALELTGDVNFGLHLAQDVQDTANFDLGMLLLMASPTLGTALERFTTNQRYWGDGQRMTMTFGAEGAVLRYVLPGTHGSESAQSAYARHSNECALAEVVLGARALTGQSLAPQLVRFSHPMPASTAEHEQVFACPLEFGAPHTELSLDEAALNTKMPHANTAFLSIFEEQMARALARLPELASTSDSVRTAARAALAGGNCTLDGTARALGVSTRTLQRRLQAEGTAFADIVDALRREMAGAYLERGLAIADVATLLGYSDSTAFHHAYRRWTGDSPSRVGRA